MHGKSLLAASISLMLLVVFTPSPTAAADWKDCIGCHAEQKEATRAPLVDLMTLEKSVHERLKCLDCHADVHEVKHTVGETPHQRYPEKVGCTTRCHVKGNTMGAPDFSPMEQYKDSVHAIAREAGMPGSAACTDCHGRHNIKSKDDPESSVYRANIPRTCAICHENMQVVVKHHIHAEKPFQEYEQSVHGKGLYRDGLVQVAAVCTDCHGIHDIQAAGTPGLRARRPETCGRCHKGIFDVYKESVHGKAAIEDQNPDAPVCADCHGEHKIAVPSKEMIPSICSQCHSEEGVMSKYEVPIDRTGTYQESYHGIASSYGSKTVANCASCHGYHDIRPPTDPKSSVYPANLVRTCGKSKCHPGISAKVASMKMHVDVKKKESGGVYYVRQFFIWTFVALIIVSFIWVIPDFVRRIRQRSAE